MAIIKAAVIHKLNKEQHGEATVQLRDEPLELTDEVQELVNNINNLYGGKVNKGYGKFEPDEVAFPSAGVLRSVFQVEGTTFVDGSKTLTTILAARAGQAPLSKGGYVLMAHGEADAGYEWFLVALINNVDGSAINDASLEIIKAPHVDLSNLRVAGRVNLTTWLANDDETRYLGFLKHRGDVADYFKNFLGCNDVVEDRAETKRLVIGLRQFAKHKGLAAEASEEFLRAAYDFCRERKRLRQPLSLEALANAAWPENPGELQQKLVEDGIQVSDGFLPDARSLASLVRLRAKTKYWSLDLDKQAFANGGAEYHDGRLVLLSLPLDLRQELDDEHDTGEDD